MKDSFTIGRGQLDAIWVFLEVAKQRSFRTAAERLGVSPSAVSQSIRRLEKQLGVTLLLRTTRQVALTDAGRHLVAHAGPSIGALAEAVRSVRSVGSEVAGLLRISAPRAAVEPILAPIVEDFCKAHPKVVVELFADDRLIDIVEEGFDAGVRTAANLDADMIAVRLSPPFGFAVVASPAYVHAYGRPRRPEDLRQHRCIGFRPSNREALYRWEFMKGRRRYSVPVDGQVIANDWNFAVSLALRGFGWAFVPAPLVASHVRQGALLSVLDEHCVRTEGAFLYYPQRAQASPKLRRFVELARRQGRRHLT
jgi:DNA-binding transcriptional LysR family regulator